MSWCTGWDFNDNHYFYATKLAGPWNKGGNIATSNTHTYESQVGFAVTVKGSKKTTFLYTGDRWSVNNYSMSRIVLLPIEVNGTKLSVKWYDQYNIDAQTGEWSAGAKYFPDGIYTITASIQDWFWAQPVVQQFSSKPIPVQIHSYGGLRTEGHLILRSPL
jgi:hypothetical protein